MPKLQIKNNDIPSGKYEADFIDCEVTDHPEYGAGLKWIWEITSGKYAGQFAYRTTKDLPTARNSCGKFLAMLAGGDRAAGVNGNTDEYRGKAFTNIIGNSEGGPTRGESFVSADDPIF